MLIITINHLSMAANAVLSIFDFSDFIDPTGKCSWRRRERQKRVTRMPLTSLESEWFSWQYSMIFQKFLAVCQITPFRARWRIKTTASSHWNMNTMTPKSTPLEYPVSEDSFHLFICSNILDIWRLGWQSINYAGRPQYIEQKRDPRSPETTGALLNPSFYTTNITVSHTTLQVRRLGNYDL